MKTRLIWKISLVAIFIAAVLCLFVQPALATDKSGNKKDKGHAEDSLDQILANGPPIAKDLPGYYYKVVPGNDNFLVKEFKNGHPINNSGWTYCGTDPNSCAPYGN